MSCENWLPLIEEYVDGELDRKQSMALRSHFASCRSCTAEYELLRREQDVYGSYDREIEVSPELWTSIRSRIREEAASGRRPFLSRLRWLLSGSSTGFRLSPAFVALLVVMAIALTVAVMRSIEKQPAPDLTAHIPAPGASPNPSTPSHPNVQQDNGKEAGGDRLNARVSTGQNAPESAAGRENETNVGGIRTVRHEEVARKSPTPEEVVNLAVKQNLTAIRVLNREIAKHRSGLDPMVVARFEAALRSVNQTIAETRQAVRQHPDDPVAAKYMLDAYAQKVEILRDMAGTQPMSAEDTLTPSR